MFGLGLVLAGCKLVLHFANRYYNSRKANYSEAEQEALETLFTVARTIEQILGPKLIGGH